MLAETPCSKLGETWREMAVTLPTKYLFHIPRGSLTFRKISRHFTDGFSSSSKEVVLRIFIALENTSSSAGFEHANVRSSGKHVNHYITETDDCICNRHQCCTPGILNKCPFFVKTRNQNKDIPLFPFVFEKTATSHSLLYFVCKFLYNIFVSV
jgi:hypothetical protein